MLLGRISRYVIHYIDIEPETAMLLALNNLISDYLKRFEVNREMEKANRVIELTPFNFLTLCHRFKMFEYLQNMPEADNDLVNEPTLWFFLNDLSKEGNSFNGLKMLILKDFRKIID